jgi:hypothetical protein
MISIFYRTTPAFFDDTRSRGFSVARQVRKK